MATTFAQTYTLEASLLAGSAASWNVTAGTIICWFRPLVFNSQWQYLVDRTDLVNTFRQVILRIDAAGTIGEKYVRAFVTGDNGSWEHSVPSTTPVTLNVWNFAALTFAVSGSLKLYKGTQAGGALEVYDAGGSIASVTNPSVATNIGAGNQGTENHVTNVDIDQTIFWDIELTAAQLAYVFNNGAGRSYNYLNEDLDASNPGTAQMSHYWKMDEQEPSAILDTIQTAPWDLNRNQPSGTVTRIATGHVDEDLAPIPPPVGGSSGYNAFVSTLIR